MSESLRVNSDVDTNSRPLTTTFSVYLGLCLTETATDRKVIYVKRAAKLPVCTHCRVMYGGLCGEALGMNLAQRSL